MANICFNILRVNGWNADGTIHQNSLDEFRKYVAGEETVFNYEDANFCELNDSEQGMLVYDFETKWEPPLDWILEISHKFSDLWFLLYAYEPDMYGVSEFHIKNGEICYEESYNPEDEYLQDKALEFGFEFEYFDAEE